MYEHRLYQELRIIKNKKIKISTIFLYDGSFYILEIRIYW